jgi:diguanylate cyclase (GGDEF)-like protein/PAS domain S-box-containing protein
VVAALAVVVAMMALADAARRDAGRALEAQVAVERVRSASQRLGAMTWRSLAPGSAQVGSPFGSEAYGGVIQTLKALRGLGVPPQRMVEVERRVGDVFSVGLNAHLLARGGSGAARRAAQSTFDAGAKLDVALDRASRRQAQVAQAAQQRARIATFASLALGLLALALLAWALHRIRRSAAMAQQARESERHGEERLRALVRHASDVVAVVDQDAIVRWVAESVRGMLGREPASLVGRRLTELAHPDTAIETQRVIERLAGDPGRVDTFPLRLRAEDGEYRDLEAVADNRIADPSINGVLINLRDVSERVELERRLRHQAFHDALTGLANRVLFEDRLNHALVRGGRRSSSVAVLFVDLDDFKTVNDSLGHAAGDELLRVIAHRLTEALRAQDTAARLGGDEFAVLLEDLGSEAEALEVAERMREALAPPATIAGHRLSVLASIGLAYTEPSVTAEEVLRNADLAMYAAKERGKAQVAAFDSVMLDRVIERLEVTGQLERAVEEQEFALVYQPLVDLQSGALAGVEALLRWDHPTRGRLAPDRFIDLAESSGAIVPIGRWVLMTACEQLRQWKTTHDAASGLTMSVNVSTRQLADPDFPGHVRAALDAAGIAAEDLTLEITEHLLLEDSEQIHGQLRTLKQIGVKLAVDDFGTGYSALSYMQTFPIDTLKIDRSFVSGIDSDPERAGLVRGIIEMGHSLRLDIVTEGIEEVAEADLLRELRSDLGQGFLFSRPIDAAAIDRLLITGKQLTAPAAAFPHRRQDLTVLHKLLLITLGATLIGAQSAAAARTDIVMDVRLVPGHGSVLLQRGTFTGTPFGRGTVRLTTRLGQGQGAVFTFVLTNRRGSVRGSGNIALHFSGHTVAYDGTANITAGSGAYRDFRARGLRMSGRGVASGTTFRGHLTG